MKNMCLLVVIASICCQINAAKQESITLLKSLPARPVVFVDYHKVLDNFPTYQKSRSKPWEPLNKVHAAIKQVKESVGAVAVIYYEPIGSRQNTMIRVRGAVANFIDPGYDITQKVIDELKKQS